MSQKLIKRHNSLALKVAVAELAAKKKHRHRSNHYCGHCEQNLCIKVYKRHKKLYKRPDQSWISVAGLVWLTKIHAKLWKVSWIENITSLKITLLMDVYLYTINYKCTDGCLKYKVFRNNK